MGHVEFYDGFDSGDPPEQRWDFNSGYRSTTTGRHGHGLCASLAFSVLALRALGATSGARGFLDRTGIKTVGFAMYFGNVVIGYTIAAFYDGANLQCDLRTDGTYLYVTRNGTTLATSTSTLLVNTWYYVEFSLAVGSSGSYAVVLDGVGWVSGSGNTQATANAFVDGFALNPNGYGNTFPGTMQPYVDDVYVRDDATTLGEVECMVDEPSADGDTDQWTPDSGANHWSRVVSNDGDTSYNSDNVVGHVDLYAFPAYSSSGGQTAAVQVVSCLRKSDAGTRHAVLQVKSGGAVHDGPDTGPLGLTYAYYSWIHETDPATGIPWTDSGVSAVQLGQKVSA